LRCVIVLAAASLMSNCGSDLSLPQPPDMSASARLRRAEARGSAAPEPNALRAEAFRRWIMDRRNLTPQLTAVCLTVSRRTWPALSGEVEPPPPPDIYMPPDEGLLTRLRSSEVPIRPAHECSRLLSLAPEFWSGVSFVDIGPITRWWDDPTTFEIDVRVHDPSRDSGEAFHYTGVHTGDGWTILEIGHP
jgi:hypothetical protein